MELIILNAIAGLYLIISVYQALKYKNNMLECAYHHYLSHIFIVASSVASINLYVYKGFTVPILFAIGYVLQHVIKEDRRLVQSNKWTSCIGGNDDIPN